MVKLTKITIPHMSLRLNLMVVCEVVLLLFLSLAVMFFFSRQALGNEVVHDAEEKVKGTRQHNINIRMNVEQATQIIYQDLLGHLNQSERMYSYCQKLVEGNPYIVGCAIAFKPNYYPDHESFVVTEQRDTTAYTTQAWYANSITARRPNWEAYWVDPLTFCQPIIHNEKCVGVMAVDLNAKELIPDEGVADIEDDIMGSYNHLIYLVLVITVVGVLVFFLLCRILIRRQMNPLRQLTDSAQQIAQGHYDKIIPDPQREDEIGQLEKHFQKMQISLASKSSELQRLTTQLTKRSEDLRKAYGQAQGSDRMKTTFLHYMTTQMIVPADLIEKSVTKLSNDYFGISPQEAGCEVEVIKQQSKVVLDLLDHMVEALRIEAEESEMEIKKGKEADHD